jgi:diguanylate cyclase (GGDEF)-like protein
MGGVGNRAMKVQVDSDSIEQIEGAGRLRAQQLSLVYSQTLRTQALSPVIAALVSATLWPVTDHRVLVAWVLVLAGISLWRHLLARSYRSAQVGPERIHIWERRFLVSLSSASAAWGIGGWAVMPPNSDAHQALVYFFVLGIAGGSSVVYAAHGRSVAVSISLILAPSAVYMLTFGDLFHYAMAIGSMLFVFAASRGTRLMNDAMRRNIQLAGEIERLGRIDVLSGLSNRRAFTDFGTTAIANASRSDRPCAVVMLDVDHFKAINDRMGHAGGDAVIRALGALLAGAVRAGECAARIGGEEFAIILPDGGEQQAHALAIRVLNSMRTLRIPLGNQEISATVSIGVAATDGAPCTLDELLARADTALYAAKRQGRNRMLVAEDPADRRSDDAPDNARRTP